MKRLMIFVVMTAMAALLAGCSASSLQQAEQNTRAAGFTPGGQLIHAPIWIASTIANMGSEPELTAADKEAQKKAVEEARKRREKYLADKAAKAAD